MAGDILEQSVDTYPLILKWRGPLKIGNLPGSKEDIANLSVCAVYIFFRCYCGGKTLVYVGKTKNFANRLAQHYGDFLSTLAGTLYHGDGSKFRPGGRPEYFQSLQANDLDKTLACGKEEAFRTTFVYARLAVAQLSEVEATIIARLKNLPDTFINWNAGFRRDLVKDCPIQHDISELEVGLYTPEERDRLHVILCLCENAKRRNA